MKKFFALLFVAILLLTVVSACAAAPATKTAHAPININAQMELSDFQFYIVGAIASAVLYFLNWAARRYPKWNFRRDWLSVFLYVVAFGLSLVWGGFTVPAFGEFSDALTFMTSLLGWVNTVLVALGPAVAFSTLIYNVLLKRVFDKWSGK